LIHSSTGKNLPTNMVNNSLLPHPATAQTHLII
jgi:hypothetical protein